MRLESIQPPKPFQAEYSASLPNCWPSPSSSLHLEPETPSASFEEGSRQRCVSDVTARPRRSCSGGDHAAMTIVRSEHRAQFTIVPNAILRDELGL